jgi:hypothetical protein
MVIANDTPYSGSHTDPLRLKHAAATKLALCRLSISPGCDPVMGDNKAKQ